jgi:hypothetical protein
LADRCFSRFSELGLWARKNRAGHPEGPAAIRFDRSHLIDDHFQDVRFGPKADVTTLFDHLVGAGEKR